LFQFDFTHEQHLFSTWALAARECEFLISEYLQLGRKHEEVCTTMMTLQQHVLVAKSIVAQAIARAAGEHAEQQQQPK
jgi:hypothetical protein